MSGTVTYVLCLNIRFKPYETLEHIRMTGLKNKKKQKTYNVIFHMVHNNVTQKT